MIRIPDQKIVIMTGSTSDLPFAHRIGDFLDKENFDIKYEYRINSAHRNTEKLLADIKDYEKPPATEIVFITIAGLSDALSGVTAGNTTKPVIACPPDLKTHNWPKTFSTAFMPIGVPVTLVTEPENAALAAAKILSLSNPVLKKSIERYMANMKDKVDKADAQTERKPKHELEREHIERVEHMEHGEHEEED
jgi:5-(carboxyamino)imidazole ribonucleotide mutase